MSTEKHTIQWLLNAATAAFESISDTPRLDAEVLLCHVIEKDKVYLFTWPEKTLTPEQLAQFEQFQAQRLTGKPVAYIVGEREFWDLLLRVSESTLIPRPDTEVVVENALSFIESKSMTTGKGLDLGTGTGAICLALASETPGWDWLGVDLVPEAVTLAKENQQRNRIINCEFKQSSWFENVPNIKFDIIVSNPPYIADDDPHLDQGDVRFEPKSALVAEKQGLLDIELICQQSRNYLCDHGCLIIEHGFEQGKAVREIFQRFGFQGIETKVDLSGNDRLTIGYFQ